MAQRRLQIVLDLDTGAYKGRLAAAGGQMRSFHGDVTRTSKGVSQMGDAFSALGNQLSVPRQKLRDYVMILGNLHFALLNVQTVALGWITSLMKQSAEVERLTVLMKGLSSAQTEVGKTEEAQNSMRRLFEMSRENGFAVRELADSFVKLKSAGIDPLKGSLDSLTQAVAFFGGTSDVMHRASIAIQQMAGKGVISMEELRQQLGEAVPTAMSDMSRAMGMSIAEFSKIVAKGKVQAKPALELMFREFELMYAGSGKRMANTLNGQLAAFRTNMMELSTAFSGLASGDTPEFRAHMEEQKRLFDEGKISAEEYRKAVEPQAGLYQTTSDALKQINQAMRSQEARQFMMSLGSAINTVATGIINVTQFVVRWRSEIGMVIGAIVVGFATIKMSQMIAWFGSLALTSGRAFGQMITGAGQLSPMFQSAVGHINGMATSYARLQSIEAMRTQTAARILSNSTQQIVALTKEASLIRDKSAAVTQNIALLGQQRQAELRSLAAAKTLHAANIAAGRDSTQSALNLAQAQAAVNRSQAGIIKQRAVLRDLNRQADAAERAFTNAVNMGATAQGRMNIASRASTTALGLKAAAARGAAIAVRGLGIAVNFALGPLGAIAMALGFAAYQAGIFESKADRAAAAAARLAKGIATVEDMKNIAARKEQIDNKIKRLEEDKAGRKVFGVTVYKADGSKKNYDNSGKTLDQLLAESKAESARLQSQINFASGLINRSTGQDLADGILAQRSLTREKTGAGYQQFVRDTNAKYGEGTPAAIKLIDAERKKLEAANKGYDKGLLDSLERRRDAQARANKDVSVYDAMISKIREATASTLDMSASNEELRKSALNAANAQGKQTGSTKDAGKAAEAASNKYNDMIANVYGSIAQLEDQLEGGQGAFAKFQAQVTNGKFKDATKSQLAELGLAFQKVDELNARIDFERSFGKLDDDLRKARIEADRMWASLKAGTFQKDGRDSQIEAQFSDEFKAAGTDQTRIGQIRDKINEIKEAVAQSDAAQVLYDWEQQIEDTRISLLDEEDQREANFQREVQRQRQLIDWSRLSAEQRMDAERRFASLVESMRAKMARENEGATVKMLRQWTKVGAAMDQTLSQSLDAFVDSLGEGKFAFGEFVKSMLLGLIKIILRAMIAYAILSALGLADGMTMGGMISGGIKDFAGGFQPNVGGNESGWTPPIISGTPPINGGAGSEIVVTRGKFHTGGWIGSNALKPGEVPIVGMKGEPVLSPTQANFYSKAFEAAIAGGRGDVHVNVINNSGQDLTAEQGSPEFNGRDMIVSVVVDAANKQGPLRDTFLNMMNKGK